MSKTKIRRDIHEAKAALKEVMQENLRDIATLMIDQIMRDYRKLSPAKRIDAIKNLSNEGVGKYKKAFLSAVAVVTAHGIATARQEVPKASKVQLSEWDEHAISLGEFDKLPSKVKKRLKAQSDLMVNTQKADLDKYIAMQFTSSLPSTDSEDTIKYDIFQTAEDYITGPSVDAGAGMMAARGINEARQAFFFEPDVLEELDAFEFRNDVPETPICEDLNGTIFSKNDPGFDRYNPPLHFNALLQGQFITTSIGQVLIENIKVGDLVKTHTGLFLEVTKVMQKFEDKEYLEIELEDNKILKITGEHPVFTSRGWIRADELNFSDDIITFENI